MSELHLTDLPDGAEISENYSSGLIVISKDKLENILMKHRQALSSSSLATPFSIAITIIITLVTTNFKDYLISAEQWSIIFILGLIGSSAWMAYAIYKKWKLRKHTSLESLIEKIKKDEAGGPTNIENTNVS